MMNNLQLLLEKVERIDYGENPQRIFHDIASKLFENWVIMRDNIMFRFLEVEFYYFSPHHPDYKHDHKTGARHPFVYNRNSKAGDLFLHNSGLDLCFQSHMSDNGLSMISGGGILLRTLLRITPEKKNTMAVMGPIDCRNALINYLNLHSLPTLMERVKPFDDILLRDARRMKGKAVIDLDKNYCFYDASKYDTAADTWLFQRYDPITCLPSPRLYSPCLNERSIQ